MSFIDLATGRSGKTLHSVVACSKQHGTKYVDDEVDPESKGRCFLAMSIEKSAKTVLDSRFTQSPDGEDQIDDQDNASSQGAP